MNNTLKNNRHAGFTLIELIVVVIIVSILASMALPKYMKTIDQTNIRNIRTQLITLSAANTIYRAQDGHDYFVDSTTNLADINTGLNINIILPTSGISFSYTSISGSGTYTASVVYAGSKTYTMTVTEAPISSSNPSCSPGGCP